MTLRYLAISVVSMAGMALVYFWIFMISGGFETPRKVVKAVLIVIVVMVLGWAIWYLSEEHSAIIPEQAEASR